MSAMAKPKQCTLMDPPTKSVRVTIQDGDSGHQINLISRKIEPFLAKIRAQIEQRLEPLWRPLKRLREE